MARARKAASSESKKDSGKAGELTCPECGKTFERAASLGAHRSRTHGVAGASARSRRGSTRRRQPAARNGSQTRNGAPSRQVDRDALLRTLFPNGVPPREDVIRRTNAWLDEAEQLTKAK